LKMKKMLIIVSLILCFLVGYIVGALMPQKANVSTNVPTDSTAIKLASSITVLRPSFLTPTIIDNYLKGTGLAGTGTAFIEAERETGIGADYLLSIAIHESGWGSNYYWKYWNNCFSWGITDSGPTWEAQFIKNNLTKYQAIVYISKKIKELYLTEGGAYYSGETLASIGKHYASDSHWAEAVLRQHKRFVKTLPAEIQAKEWIMETRILKGDEPYSLERCSSTYWTRPLTRAELAIILYRIQNKP